MRTIYACIWRAHESDETFVQSEFESRIPRLMVWLRELYNSGHLIGCGGGAFENHSGGLTLIQADSVEEAISLSNGTPMNEIGTTDIMIWDVFYANLQHLQLEDKLRQ